MFSMILFVEIPRLGVIRSLNVHVSGAISEDNLRELDKEDGDSMIKFYTRRRYYIL